MRISPLFLLSGMLSPLLGIAGVNSLLFASYGLSKRIVTPFGELSLPQTALAGAMAGAANAILASPGEILILRYHAIWEYRLTSIYS
jgi:solute carrier family 25 carnitine/acylcarnitine transporter 20/29